MFINNWSIKWKAVFVIIINIDWWLNYLRLQNYLEKIIHLFYPEGCEIFFKYMNILEKKRKREKEIE